MVVAARTVLRITYFVGALNSPNQIAAVSLASLALYLQPQSAVLFGVGTSSLISTKSLRNRTVKVQKKIGPSVFWHAAVCNALPGYICSFFSVSLTKLLGADEQTVQPMMEYLFFWTIGNRFYSHPMLNTVLSKQVALEGYANHAKAWAQ